MNATIASRKLKDHGRFPYRSILNRPDYVWPNQSRLAVYIGFNLEHFEFGEGLGANLGPACPAPDVLNYSWREYGNRVGAWRCIEMFDALKIPTSALINTSLYDHCPELIEALVQRGDEIVGHGHTNAERQGQFDEQSELDLIQACAQRIERESGKKPRGWLSPWISESPVTPDLLAETGYDYTLNWCHDDQPTRMQTRNNQSLWSIPYPQEINDIPMLIGRQMDTEPFANMIIDQFDEMLQQSKTQPLVMGIALHPYLIGQPYRLKHIRRALQHICDYRDREQIWFSTPGEICSHMQTLDRQGLVNGI